MDQGLRKKPFFFLLLFFFLGIWLNAQTAGRKNVALLPFWGNDQGIIEGFGFEVYSNIRTMHDFAPILIDMTTNLPPDVPPGGFPPYMCPSSSVTQAAPFALTGEIAVETRTGQWRLRLYLWRMSDTRLIMSDELAAYNQEECRDILPSIMGWMFTWAKEEAPAPVVLTAPTSGEREVRVIYLVPSEPLKWLYLGLRVGGSLRIYSDLESGKEHPDTNQVTSYENFHGAFHANVQLLSFLGLQVEAMYTYITDEHYLFESWSWMFPFMLRLSHRIGSMTFAAFGGGYYWLPMGETSNTDNKYLYIPEGDPLGYVAGVMFGNRVGPGYIYLDLRWTSDLTDHRHRNRDTLGYGFHRNMFNISLGYEVGLFTKR